MAGQSGKRSRGVKRKRRTRAHIIADLSANFVERFVLLSGHTVERTRHDYGVDMLVFFYGAGGELLDGHVSLQLKASDRLNYVMRGTNVAIRIDRRDLHHWLSQTQPVFLVAYDARREQAYWLYVQRAPNRQRVQTSKGHSRLTVHIPTKNVMTVAAVREFLRYNERIKAQLRARHHD